VNQRKTLVPAQSAGMRLDVFVTRHLLEGAQSSGLSRSGIQRLIAARQVTVNGRPAKPATRLRENDVVLIQDVPAKQGSLAPEPIALDVIYEDGDCIVVNKAPGMVVHPAAGRTGGTLVNAILHRCPDLQGIGGEYRPGIVHRLDKDTSGVMIVAKNAAAFQRLAQQFKDRRVNKEYLALIWGRPKTNCGTINRPIGRHRSDRKRMSSVYSLPRKREAVTEWSVEKCFRHENAAGWSWVSLLRLKPMTGRTHQIRVHLADLGYPLLGDKIYGRKPVSGAQKSAAGSRLSTVGRHALHAERLRLFHPTTGKLMEFYAPLAKDIVGLLQTLEEQDVDWRRRENRRGG
jgi:23S rRNA pseudouridine1911/1915/1917 synthase